LKLWHRKSKLSKNLEEKEESVDVLIEERNRESIISGLTVKNKKEEHKFMSVQDRCNF
jgi:phenylpyruvate tautomerase PptA (4-oxalocrotonate tautomerase family)